LEEKTDNWRSDGKVRSRGFKRKFGETMLGQRGHKKTPASTNHVGTSRRNRLNGLVPELS